MKKKVGIFGGSFDPIHFGHINLAKEIYQKKLVDEIIFCPANISPYKMKNPPIAPKEMRLEMIKLSIQNYEGFSVSDLEIKREAPSYTIDTLRSLSSDQIDLRLIVTIDQLESFQDWKEYKEILKIAPLIIGRKSEESKKLNIDRSLYSNSNFIQNKILDISSTEIRRLLKNRVYCSDKVPKEVLDYIYEHKLYY